MAIADYLSNLVGLRDSLKSTLTARGLATEEKTTLAELIPMVEEISGSGAGGAFEKAQYRFGVLSDIHLKDAAYGETQEDMADVANSLTDYQRALTFYKNNGVDFICVDGDIVANSRGTNEDEESIQEWCSEIQLFRQYNDAYSGGIPIYATTGNHDACPYGYSTGAGGKNMDMVIPATVYGDGTMKAEEVWEAIIGKPIRYTFTQGNDVFIFLPMYYWNYINFYRDEDEDWIIEQLEAHKNKRVFLFFHLMLNGTYDIDGDGMSTSYAAGAVSRFRPLIAKYSNVIWFTGHTHYDLWREGGMQPDGVTPYVNPNIYQSEESMTMVHCPSCAYIREKNAAGKTERNYPGSQGLIVDVFADRVIVKGIDFTQGEGGALIPKATYVINM